MSLKNKNIDFAKFLAPYCSKEWIMLIQNFIVLKSYKKNQHIFSVGDKVKGIYFINSGKVKVTAFFNDESERILRLSSSGDLLGHRAFMSNTFPISSTALTDTDITFIPIDIYLKLIKTNPDFALYLLEFYADDLRSSEERMSFIIHGEVINRLNVILCMLIDAFGFESDKSKRLAFMLSRTDIANFAGTTYESVVRNLAKLEELGWIKIDGKNIIILKEKDIRKSISRK